MVPENPKICVIMPVNLDNYEGAAMFREQKFIRAVKSFLSNSYENKFLVIVSDGCQKAKDIFYDYFANEKNIHLIKIKKQPLFSGYVRQTGIDWACNNIKPDIFAPLDSDDFLLDYHLAAIAEKFGDNDFIYADELYFLKSGQLGMPPLPTGQTHGLALHKVELKENVAGTSSVVWKNKIEFNWDDCDGWGHDFKFISEKLIPNSKKYSKVEGLAYVICHMKGRFDN